MILHAIFKFNCRTCLKQSIEFYSKNLVASTDCQNAILNSTMSYNASSTSSNLSPRYIAPFTKNFPWGPDSLEPDFKEYVTIDLRDTYLITGVRTFHPVYAGLLMKQPLGFTLSFQLVKNRWIQYTGGSKEWVSYFVTISVVIILDQNDH